MTPEDFRVARSLADRLMASCMPSEHWDEINGLSRGQCLALDSIAFECCVCSHWHPVAEKQNAEGSLWYCKGCDPG